MEGRSERVSEAPEAVRKAFLDKYEWKLGADDPEYSFLIRFVPNKAIAWTHIRFRHVSVVSPRRTMARERQITMLDLLVIGAGLSGLCAALTAAESGQSVRVVAKGMGALHWAAGSFDLLGYLPGSPLATDDPLGSIASLPNDHPYQVAGKEAVGTALENFAGWLRAEDVIWHGADVAGHNMLLPSPVGAVRPVFLAPGAQKAGEILPATGGGAPMVIVGITGDARFLSHAHCRKSEQAGATAPAPSLCRGRVWPPSQTAILCNWHWAWRIAPNLAS
jgi:hypothetical protein